MQFPSEEVMSDNLLRTLVREIIVLEDLALEIKNNYCDNRWWPTRISDWRLRMLLAGWTTRVSYSAIQHYQDVVKRSEAIGFDGICKLSDCEVENLTKRIGLPAARLTYLRSLSEFLKRSDSDFILKSEAGDVLEKFATMVDGASFKVAQCALLYARGYDCGIIPVDSGMCEMLAPAIPTSYPKSGIGHEIVRTRLEEFARTNKSFLEEQMRHHLHNWTQKTPPAINWWFHLMLIYYKRLYWNRGKSHVFPRGDKFQNCPPRIPPCPNKSTFPFIVVEGIDGAGKSTFSDNLVAQGYRKQHSPYNAHCLSLSDWYKDIINHASEPTIYDRFFLSELVYGKVLRNGSRINSHERDRLLSLMRAKQFTIIFLTESAPTIEERRGPIEKLKELLTEYKALAKEVRPQIATYSMTPSSMAPAFYSAFFDLS